jgi:uncharacterized protein (TIGR02246 family)
MRAKSTLLYLIIAAAACTTTATNADSTKAGDTSNTAAASDDQAKSDIATIRSGWKDASDKKDSTAVANYYADDAVLATSEAPLSEGKAAIEKTLGRMVNMAKINSIDSKQLVVMGNDAYDYGTFSQTVTMPNGKTADQSGYYLVTLHKGSDGAWKITHHVSTNPPVAH